MDQSRLDAAVARAGALGQRLGRMERRDAEKRLARQDYTDPRVLGRRHDELGKKLARTQDPAAKARIAAEMAQVEREAEVAVKEWWDEGIRGIERSRHDATRASTWKHEVVSPWGGVAVTGVSRTEAESIAKAMNKGVPKNRHVWVRPVKIDAESRHDKGEWDESKHPRARDGKFGSGGGSAASGGSSTATKTPPPGKQRSLHQDVAPLLAKAKSHGEREKAAEWFSKMGENAAASAKADKTAGFHEDAKTSEHLADSYRRAANLIAGKPENASFNAKEYAASHDDPNVTTESIMEKLAPEQRKEIEDLHEKIRERGITIDRYRDDQGEYAQERRDMHDAILYEGRMGHDPDNPGQKKWYEGILSHEKIKAATPPPGQKPTFTVLGGRGGSGKSQLRDKVYTEDHSIVLDADVIKHMIEEFEGWNANEVHEESSDIVDAALKTAREKGLNVVFDATMKSSGPALEKVAAFKDAGFDIEAHYMHLPRQIAAERTIDRYFSPGRKKGNDPSMRARYAPAHIVLGNRLNEDTFDQVRQHAKRWSFHDNNVERGKDAELIAHGGYDE